MSKKKNKTVFSDDVPPEEETTSQARLPRNPIDAHWELLQRARVAHRAEGVVMSVPELAVALPDDAETFDGELSDPDFDTSV